MNEEINFNYLMTDSGTAHCFANRWHKKIRYNAGRKQWIVYDGKRWTTDGGEGAAKRMMRDSAKIMQMNLEHQRSSEDLRIFTEWMKKSNSNSGIQAALAMAMIHEKIEVFDQVLDQHPCLLNCLNGTINLRSGELKEHDPKDLITQLAPAKYDPEATFEPWEKFLEDTTGGDVDLRRFLQKAVGYSANGTAMHELMFLIHGPTRSGKGTFTEAVKATLGDYVKTVDFEVFMQKKRDPQAAQPAFARLLGSRMLFSSEIEEGSKMAEGLFKRFTGRDTINTRHLYGRQFEFMPQFTPWLMTNHCPKIKSDSVAVWKRVLRVPFSYTVPDEKIDPSLKDLLMDTGKAGPAILAWIVEGNFLWRKEGIKIPKAVQESTDEYKESQKPLKEFFEDECEFGGGPEYFVSVAKMRARYEEWGMECGMKHLLQAQSFNKQMIEKGIPRAKAKFIQVRPGVRGPVKCWFGVKLKGK